MATTSERLKEIISIRNVKQAEIVEHTGINKGALSSYISGRYLPKQDNIYRLAKYFSVNPAWLMGLDVPMETPEGAEMVGRARQMFELYEKASPEIRAAVEILLKSNQSDS